MSRGARHVREEGPRWSADRAGRLPSWWERALAVALIVFGGPPARSSSAGRAASSTSTIQALAYVVMALGLNIVVGFAGLLDLGYVAFFAFGAYTIGWFGSGFFFKAHIHFGRRAAGHAPGIHLNFLLIVVIPAMHLRAGAGSLIGLPTLRLRGDYIAIVTLAFGEIIRVFAVNGDRHPPRRDRR